MDLKANSIKSDGLADLVRAAQMMAEGRYQRCVWFMNESKKKIGEVKIKIENIDVDKNLFWSEKILDEYYRLRWGKLS